MSRIGKNGFFLIFLIWIDSIKLLNSCGCCTQQDMTVVNLSNAIQLLTSQMELIKYNLESMNLNIKLLDSRITDSKDIFIGYLPDYEKHPKTNEPRTKLTDNDKNFHEEKIKNNVYYHEEKNQNNNNQEINPKSNQNVDNTTSDNCTASMETFIQLNKMLTENVKKLELLLDTIPVSEKEDQANTPHYDKHFNCIRNCSSNVHLPKSCSEATAINGFKDAAYLLNVSYIDLKPFYTYCAHEKANEKGWMIIQRREDGSINFNRNWLEYKRGFGDLYGEYWIGLERLHAITKNQSYEIAIVLKDYDGNQRFAKYSKFSVASEDEGYKLSLDCYSGDAGDSLKHHNFMKFSTFDRDNDKSFANCAQMYKGGWWYDDCYSCNLNGAYYSSANKNAGCGINWVDWHGYNYSLKYTHMAIRPI